MVLTSGPTSTRPGSPVPGEIRFNTDLGLIEAYYSSSWNTLARIGSSTIIKDEYTGDGTTSQYTMSVRYATSSPTPIAYNAASSDENKVIVFIGGVFQIPGESYNFSNFGNDILFTSTPPTAQKIVVLHNFASTNAF